MPEKIMLTIIASLLFDVRRCEKYIAAATNDNDRASIAFWTEELKDTQEAMKWIRSKDFSSL